MKIIIWIIAAITGLGIASGLNFCIDNMDISTNCSMLTPTINCTTPTYTIYDTNGTIINNGNLTNFTNDGIYYFNISLPEGDYYTRLCDDSTKQFRIKGNDDMLTIGIILLPLIMAGIFLYWGQQLEEENILKRLFQLLVIPLFWLSIHFGVISVGAFFPSLSEYVDTLAMAAEILGYIFLIVLAYQLYKLAEFIINRMIQRRAEEDEERYG